MTRVNKETVTYYGKKAAGTLVIPVVCLLVSIIMCASSGTSLFIGTSSWNNLIYGIVFQVIIAFAVSINLHSGRFDFSIGSMLTLCSTSVIIMARNGVDNMFVLLLVSTLIGLACGIVSGLLYILLKLPSMIISLGCALLFESFAYIVTSGTSVSVQTGSAETYNKMNVFVGNTGNYAAILIIGFIVVFGLVILFNFTKFGNNYHALQNGQKIAVATGIKEIKNALFCYALCGFLVGIDGMLFGCKVGSTSPDRMLNFASIAVMFSAFCPLFFADFIRRYIKKEGAIFVGVISYQFIQLAFGNMNSINTDFTSTIYGIINSLILVCFLIYLNNEKKVNDFVTFKKLREKKAEAR